MIFNISQKLEWFLHVNVNVFTCNFDSGIAQVIFLQTQRSIITGAPEELFFNAFQPIQSKKMG